MGKNKVFEKIYKSKRQRAAFVKEFQEVVENCGETLLGEISDKYIFDVFKNQGYWSGVEFNIHYYKDGGFEPVQRRFGK